GLRDRINVKRVQGIFNVLSQVLKSQGCVRGVRQFGVTETVVRRSSQNILLKFNRFEVVPQRGPTSTRAPDTRQKPVSSTRSGSSGVCLSAVTEDLVGVTHDPECHRVTIGPADNFVTENRVRTVDGLEQGNGTAWHYTDTDEIV